MLLKITPFINNFFNHNDWNKLDISPCFYELPLFSLITNCQYQLYKITIHKNSPIYYLNYNNLINFNKLLNNEVLYKPISHIITKNTTHYIPKLPLGPKLYDMYIPIKTNDIPMLIINEIGNCKIECSDNTKNFIILNENPKLKISINKWDINNNMINEDIIINFKMNKWGEFEPIEKKSINTSNILYIFWDLSDFIYINDIINNLDKIYDISFILTVI
jgi:hypothetical protein